MFPTDTSGENIAWPAGCSSDAEVVARTEEVHAHEDAIEEKIALLIELDAFERSRSSIDAAGESTDDVRLRYKVSQAAWASRFEKSKGRRLRLEPAFLREQYNRDVAAWIKALERGCKNNQIDYNLLRTDTPFDQALTAYLGKRRRLG